MICFVRVLKYQPRSPANNGRKLSKHCFRLEKIYRTPFLEYRACGSKRIGGLIDHRKRRLDKVPLNYGTLGAQLNQFGVRPLCAALPVF